MIRISALVLTLALCLSGCASLKVIPEPVETGTIDVKQNSQTITNGGVAISVHNADADTFSYNLDEPVAVFSVTILNDSGNEVAFEPSSFLLVDNDNRQYNPLTPDKLKEMISKSLYYLIPYPYVGFYYTEDYEKTAFYNRFTSDLPYFYEVYPQDIYTKSLPAGGIIPKAKVSGLVFFKIDLKDKKHVKLLVYRQGASKSAPPDFAFPFRITN